MSIPLPTFFPALHRFRLVLATLCLPVVLSIATVRAAEVPASEIKDQRDIPYLPDGNPRHQLDIFSPAKRDSTPLPCIVSIHGGAWLLGGKFFCPVKFAIPHGFVVASIGYRLTDDGKCPFPAQLQDCQAALKFLVEHASTYGIDPGKIIISGDSAGAHLALLLGMAPLPASVEVKMALKVRGIVDFYGPTDLPGYLADAQAIRPDTRAEKEINNDAVVKLLGGTPQQKPELAKEASPLTYVSPHSPSVLILHGSSDDVVPLAQAQRLHEALDKAGVKNEYFVLPGAIHSDMRFGGDDIHDKVVAFIEAAVK